MSDAVIVTVIMGVVIIPTIAVIGFLLKGLLNSIESKIDQSSGNVVELKISSISITSALTSIEKDFDRQRSQVSELNTMLISNVNKTIEHGHEINNLKAQGKMIVKMIEDK